MKNIIKLIGAVATVAVGALVGADALKGMKANAKEAAEAVADTAEDVAEDVADVAEAVADAIAADDIA